MLIQEDLAYQEMLKMTRFMSLLYEEIDVKGNFGHFSGCGEVEINFKLST